MDDLHEQKTLIMESAALGASIALNRLGLIKDEISQREAYRIYGESCVRTWLNRGLFVKRLERVQVMFSVRSSMRIS